MCLHPVLIKNVNYGNSSKLSYISDSTAQYIPVPCGRCSVCLQLKQQYIVQRVQMESLSHDLFFLTLTYNNESIPVIERGEFRLNYVDLSDWQKMIKMIRKHESLPSFRYLLVTEYGGRRHRPHIHAILSFPKNDSDTLAQRRSFELKLYQIFLKYWRRNYGSTRLPVWRNLCTFHRTSRSWNYDLHYLDPWSTKTGLEDVAFYATKYALKYDSWIDKLKSKLFFSLPESDYLEVWNTIRPRRLMSKGFGSPSDPKVIDHINKGINLALSDLSAMYPYFVSPVNGNTFPLSPYYSKKFLSLNDLLVFNCRKPTLTDYDMMLDSADDKTLYEIQQLEYRFGKVRDFLDHRHSYFDDDDILLNNQINLDYGNYSEAPFLDQVFAEAWKDFDVDSDLPC